MARSWPGASWRKIGRTDDLPLALEDRKDLAPAVDVIAQRDAVDAGGDQFVVDWPASGPEPPAAFSALATTRSMPLLGAVSPRRACTQICRPGLPTMSPMKQDSHGSGAWTWD